MHIHGDQGLLRGRSAVHCVPQRWIDMTCVCKWAWLLTLVTINMTSLFDLWSTRWLTIADDLTYAKMGHTPCQGKHDEISEFIKGWWTNVMGILSALLVLCDLLIIGGLSTQIFTDEDICCSLLLGWTSYLTNSRYAVDETLILRHYGDITVRLVLSRYYALHWYLTCIVKACL